MKEFCKINVYMSNWKRVLFNLYSEMFQTQAIKTIRIEWRF